MYYYYILCTYLFPSEHGRIIYWHMGSKRNASATVAMTETQRENRCWKLVITLCKTKVINLWIISKTNIAIFVYCIRKTNVVNLCFQYATQKWAIFVHHILWKIEKPILSICVYRIAYVKRSELICVYHMKNKSISICVNSMYNECGQFVLILCKTNVVNLCWSQSNRIKQMLSIILFI